MIKKTSKPNDYQFINQKQQELYETVMIGLKKFTKQELYQMSESKKRMIHNRYKFTQRVLNQYKNTLITRYSNFILSKYFPKSVIDKLNNVTDVNSNFKCELTFQELDITRTEIINLLIDKKILPKTFKDLA